MIGILFFRRSRGLRSVPAFLESRRRARREILLCLVPIAVTGCHALSHEGHPRADSPPSVGRDDASQGKSISVPPMTRNDTQEKPSAAQHKLSRDDRYKAHLELGQFQESQENLDLALGEYEKALESCESAAPRLSGARSQARQALAHRRIAATLDRLGRFEQAENHYRTALKISPNDSKVWNDAGYSYYLQSRWADAERALKTADSLDPNNTRVLTNLGLTLAASGKTDEALAAFSKSGGQAVGHANLAYILAAMGKNDLAIKHYSTALEYQPDLGAAKVGLTALVARVGQETQLAATGPPQVKTPTPIVAVSPSLPAVSPPIAAPVPTTSQVAPPIAAMTPPAPKVSPTTNPKTSPGDQPLLARSGGPTSTLSMRQAKPDGSSKPSDQATGAVSPSRVDPGVNQTSNATLIPMPKPINSTPGN